jgi:actin-like protein 6A
MFCGDDTGSVVGEIAGYYSRFGNSGEDLPKYQIPSDVVVADGKTYVGESGISLHGRKGKVQNPMESGEIVNWDHVETLWEYFYAKGERTSPEDVPTMVLVPTWVTEEELQTYGELMFEKFQVPHSYFQKKSAASAFAAGRPTALVVDSGYQQTSVTPVYQGHVLTKPSKRSNLGGELLSKEMLKALESTGAKVKPRFAFKKKIESSYSSNNSDEADFNNEAIIDIDISKVHESYMAYAQCQIAQDAKEYFCHMPRTPYNETLASKIPPDVFELPDGNQVDLRLARYTIPELNMNCSPLRSEYPDIKSIPEIVAESLSESNADIRKLLANNCVLAGGNTLFKGFQQRLNLELQNILPKILSTRFVVPGPLERRSSAWTGGSILATLGSFQQLWISKAEYDEVGNNIVAKRCWR